MSAFARLYEKLILRHPLLVVLAFGAGLIFFGYNLKNFRMDASSDSLILENDADLKYYEATREIFGSDDYIVLAVTLREHLLSDNVLRTLESLSRELERVSNIESVNSVLTVPLFHSPKVSLYEMGTQHKTLLMEGCDRQLAYQELTTSPLWRNNLISEDGKTTAIVLTFKPNAEFNALRDDNYRLPRQQEHSRLRRQQASGSLTADEERRMRTVNRAYNEKHAELSAQRRADVRE